MTIRDTSQIPVVVLQPASSRDVLRLERRTPDAEDLRAITRAYDRDRPGSGRRYRSSRSRTCACGGWIRVGDYIVKCGDTVTHAICWGSSPIEGPDGYPWEDR